jgi:hypothetical protein
VETQVVVAVSPGSKIGEVAARSGLSVKTIRFYCDEGLISGYSGIETPSFNKEFGCVRVVWNDALEKSRELYAAGEKTSYPVLAKLCITQAKQTPERSWLSGPSNVVLQQSVRDLDQAFRNW